MEVWKDIPGYEKLYQASNLGRIRSLDRIIKRTNQWKKEYYQKYPGKILRLHINPNGYYGVDLKGKNKKVHQLVAMAFLGHTPCGYKVVIDHINNNRLDNRVENLQITTQRVNNSKDRVGNSKYTGVCFNKNINKYHAYIRVNRVLKHLGYYEKEYDAHLAYQKELSIILQKENK